MSKRDEILAYIEQHPTAKPRDVYRAVGCSRHYYYQCLERPRPATPGKPRKEVIARTKMDLYEDIKVVAQIDALVDSGKYASRSDFLRQATLRELGGQG